MRSDAVAGRGYAGTRTLCWRRHLTMLAGAMLLLVALLSRDVAGIGAAWWRTAAYHHCLVIPAIIVWLIWQRRDALAATRPGYSWLGIAILTGGMGLWLIGAAGYVASFRQAGLVIGAIGLAVALLGRAAGRVLLLPLGFALFLIPVGSEAEPLLQQVTARIALALLQGSGTPAVLEGVFITTPAGLFRIAEACSGTGFLLAMAAYAVLVCATCFRNSLRRALFVAVALPVAILANGVRAYAIIQSAAFVGIDSPQVTDHALYGWLLFAGVLALLMWAASRWFETVPHPAPSAAGQGAGSTRGGAPLLAAIFGLVVMPQLWIGATEARPGSPSPPPLAPAIAGWMRLPGLAPEWQPHFDGATWIGRWRYRGQRGEVVDVAVIVFDRQGEGRELVGFGQGAAAPDGAGGWADAGRAPAPAHMAGQWLRAADGAFRFAATSYVIGDAATGSTTIAKVRAAVRRLAGGGQGATAVIVSVPVTPRADAIAVAAHFIKDAGGPAEVADRARAIR